MVIGGLIMEEISNIGQLVESLKSLASTYDDLGCHDGVADGVRQSIRLIDDHCSSDQIISASECVPSNAGTVKELAQAKARIDILMNQLSKSETITHSNKIEANNSFGNEYDFMAFSDEINKLRSDLARGHLCLQCRGVGKYKPLAMFWHCDLCEGTGVNLENPLDAIKKFKELADRSVMVTGKLAAQVYRLSYSAKERDEHSAAKFYQGVGKADM